MKCRVSGISSWCSLFVCKITHLGITTKQRVYVTGGTPPPLRKLFYTIGKMLTQLGCFKHIYL